MDADRRAALHWTRDDREKARQTDFPNFWRGSHDTDAFWRLDNGAEGRLETIIYFLALKINKLGLLYLSSANSHRHLHLP